MDTKQQRNQLRNQARTQLRLTCGDVTGIRLDGRQRLRVSTGVLWVTIEGDERDFFLHPGEWQDLPAARRVVIEALSEAVFALDMADEQSRQPDDATDSVLRGQGRDGRRGGRWSRLLGWRGSARLGENGTPIPNKPEEAPC